MIYEKQVSQSHICVIDNRTQYNFNIDTYMANRYPSKKWVLSNTLNYNGETYYHIELKD